MLNSTTSKPMSYCTLHGAIPIQPRKTGLLRQQVYKLLRAILVVWGFSVTQKHTVDFGPTFDRSSTSFYNLLHIEHHLRKRPYSSLYKNWTKHAPAPIEHSLDHLACRESSCSLTWQPREPKKMQQLTRCLLQWANTNASCTIGTCRFSHFWSYCFPT